MASSLAYVAGDVAFNPFGDLDFLLLDLELAGLGALLLGFCTPLLQHSLSVTKPNAKTEPAAIISIKSLGGAVMHMQLISFEAPVIHTCQGLNASSPPSSPSPPSRTHRILQSSQPLPRNNSIPTSTTLY